jgi:lipid-A-disaccharide synthase
LNENAPSLLVVVGDLSADRHASKVLAKLKESAPQLKVWGIGSESMKREGAELLLDCKDFSSIGIVGILKLVPFLIGLRKRLLAEMAVRKPQAVLLVDYGGFNLFFAEGIKKQFPSTPVLYFISPQVWGSRPWRIKTIAKTITKMLVIFPFERTLYEEHKVPVRFVGHPLAQDVESFNVIGNSREEFCHATGLRAKDPIIAVFPGSRKSEIKILMPVLMQGMNWLFSERPNVQFVISEANEDLGKQIRLLFGPVDADKRNLQPVYISASKNQALLASADLVWAKSGTTTLEVTLFGKPMLVFYRGDWLSYFIFLALKMVRRVSWPNLLAGRELVPELIQLDCRAEQLVKYSRDLLDVPKLREEISAELLSLRDQLGEGDFASACAEEILKVVKLQDLITKT